MAYQDFERRLYEEWLPGFCHDSKRQLSTSGFKGESIKISEFDAENFIRALDSGLVKDSGGGRYRCEKSNAFEQIFWTGLKAIKPRPLTLWLEPVITIGTIARLGLDLGWPSDLLGMQSKGWAFDFIVLEGNNSSQEYIAGEVKKTERELDNLILNLKQFGKERVIDLPANEQKKGNSFKKWKALMDRKAPFLWAVGPNNYTHAFSIQYKSNNRANFSSIEVGELKSRIAI